MKISELNWSSFDTVTYDDDLLISVHAGLVTLLIRGRNAWHSTWVEHYLRNATMFRDVVSAKEGAELSRGRGNVFYVAEAPALQLRGAVSNVVVCDSHAENPFGRFVGFDQVVHPGQLGPWIGGLFPGVSVRDAVNAFAHDSGFWKGPKPSEYSLLVGDLTPGINLSRRSGKLVSFSSEAVGVDYYLSWQPTTAGNRYTSRGVNAIERKWNQSLEFACIKPDTIDSEIPARLVKHRTETLRAIPYSIWKKRKQEEYLERLSALSSTREELSEALAHLTELEWSLEIEREEFTAAWEARMNPADTSDGIRQQRERVEASATRIRNFESEVESARRKAERLKRVLDQLGYPWKSL